MITDCEKIVRMHFYDNRLSNNDVDFYKEVASLWFETPVSDVTQNQRRLAKIVSFNEFYGFPEIAYLDLFDDTECRRTRARELIKSFYNSFPNFTPADRSTIEFMNTIDGER